MTTPTGTALLAQASAEDLERDAEVLQQYATGPRHAIVDLYGRESLARLAALARAVAVWERDKMADPEVAVHQGTPVPAALAALLGGEDAQ